MSVQLFSPLVFDPLITSTFLSQTRQLNLKEEQMAIRGRLMLALFTLFFT